MIQFNDRVEQWVKKETKARWINVIIIRLVNIKNLARIVGKYPIPFLFLNARHFENLFLRRGVGLGSWACSQGLASWNFLVEVKKKRGGGFLGDIFSEWDPWGSTLLHRIYSPRLCYSILVHGISWEHVSDADMVATGLLIEKMLVSKSPSEPYTLWNLRSTGVYTVIKMFSLFSLSFFLVWGRERREKQSHPPYPCLQLEV